MGFEAREAAVRFPFAVADTTEGTCVHRVACTGSTQNYPLKEFQKGKYIRFSVHAAGTALSYVQVAAAGSAQNLTKDVAGTSVATVGLTVPAGSFIDGILPNGATHLVWISDSANGYVEFYISEVVAK